MRQLKERGILWNLEEETKTGRLAVYSEIALAYSF